ncbi:hypothetical protein REMIM1_CH04166 [Rhizobium etli bv. mimosae str. Mim1]|nr:hypothetical protein REMIM1_CH04166 [Rhizobium etli bv. mimosae str. Mim1]
MIDAMDLLHSGRFDDFCLVSPYSNFSQREQVVDITAFASRNAEGFSAGVS